MKADLTGIRNIIFDLGNVLLNLDFNASIQAFRDLGLGDKVVDNEQVYTDPVFYELETGQISAALFRERVRRVLNNPEVSDSEIDDAWCAMVLDVPENRVSVIRDLGENYNVFLFSNTNPIHMERLHNQFESEYGFKFSSLFVKDFYSHDIRERKPDLSSFHKVIQLAGVKPEESLFVDDLKKNIDGAQKAGLKTFWLTSDMELTEIF